MLKCHSSVSNCYSIESSTLHETNSSSKLFESRLCRLSELFEASESFSPIRSIRLAFGRSLLSSPDYPLIIIIAFSLCSFPHPSAISSSVSWMLAAEGPYHGRRPGSEFGGDQKC